MFPNGTCPHPYGISSRRPSSLEHLCQLPQGWHVLAGKTWTLLLLHRVCQTLWAGLESGNQGNC